ncbi:hypothetical protein MNBD_ALPHA07-1264 [hydrothermal vent metagenome]|uniref:Uncharacterized protein n=1 Tax=hydrothermal vent metagenome TaxID=652676 RepID=A0A3B0SEL0_9ZZZZ
MKIVLHAGAHATDEGKLNECLLQNRGVLAEHGTEVPVPAEYQQLIRDVLHRALDTGISDDTRDVLLDTILKGDTSERLILSNHRFFGTPKMAAYGGILYETAETRLGFYQRMFFGDQIELFMGLCNPVTFLPQLLSKTRFATMEHFLRDNSPFDIRWSDLIRRMHEAAPNIGITIWCNEDTPLIWGRIMREMAGLKPGQPLKGEYALMQEIMRPEGMKRFEAYLTEKPGLSEAQKRHVAAVFLEKYAIEGALDHEIDVPGWDHEMVERLTEIYDEDLAVISRIPNVNLITP